MTIETIEANEDGYRTVVQPRLWTPNQKLDALGAPSFHVGRPHEISAHLRESAPPKPAAPSTAILLNIEQNAQNELDFVDPHDTIPKLDGSIDQPDVKATVELVAFNSGTGDQTDNLATLRFDFGQSPDSDSRLAPVFWSIAAGMDLAQLIKDKQPAAKSYRSNFDTAFSNRPIEIGGGIGRMRLQVFRYHKPTLWEQLFAFASSPTGKALVQALGFPAIAMDAVKILDEAIHKVFGDQRKPIFQSDFSSFAMSKRAKDEYEAGGIIRIGVLNAGISMLVPAQHLPLLRQKQPRYYKDLGLLPKDVTPGDFVASGYVDPFENVPYAVLRVKSDKTKIIL